jgi:hypothetical protein
MFLARAKIDDLRRQGATARLALDARAATPARGALGGDLADGSVTLRPCRAEDRVRLARLAALDSSETLAGPVLLAVVGGEVRAALSLTDGTVATDPFEATAALASLLRAYSRQPDLRAAAFDIGQC